VAAEIGNAFVKLIVIDIGDAPLEVATTFAGAF